MLFFIFHSSVSFIDERIADSEAGTFDMVYIDADKWKYTVYYDKCMELVHKGGLILIDDVSVVLKDELLKSLAKLPLCIFLKLW